MSISAQPSMPKEVVRARRLAANRSSIQATMVGGSASSSIATVSSAVSGGIEAPTPGVGEHRAQKQNARRTYLRASIHVEREEPLGRPVGVNTEHTATHRGTGGRR